ncbi:probable glucan 1,3-beta-glucosidase A [Coffea arabica]|uniref:Probable glucan 1,3-beta-glucosidase A n=1 Tax=Coffea arabica TaxID=13443 RepID=A0A6P6UI49_COFAR|nr:probable glucan 1,3-beta-glucosidase A [Coffea arabica]
MATIKCFFILLSCFFSISNGRVPPAEFPVKAVNLGGWLVTEGWIKPSLFDGIHNKDLLDGTGIQFKSAKSGKYLSAETFKIGGSAKIVAKKTSAAEWETFKLWRVDSSNYSFRAANTQFVALGLDGKQFQSLITVAKDPTIRETFEIIRKADDLNRVRIKGLNGFFWQVKSEGVVTADWDRFNTTWEDDDPSVFLITTVGGYQGEYQVTNGYGPLTAPQVMKEHWNTYIVENDFKFIAENGLNAVRIPVGWWIAGDPNPPKPFVGGSLQALDNAFLWAQKYGLKVIIDLHAAPGSQNGMEHSATRDGSLEWGLTDESIQQTVAVIDFLAARYAKNPSLLAVELLNEPLAPGVALDTLTRYYRDAYDAVRKHSSTAYVILSNRLGPADHSELFALASVLTKPVIDVHYYNLFSTIFTNMTVQQHIDYVKTNRTAELASITSPNGPKIFVGEWVAEWDVKGATRQDYQAFARAQLHAFEKATFGWAYWTLKNAKEHWSLEWMINNGYLKA